MGDVEKSIHITDKKNNIDLNIYDKGESFTFEFSYNVAGAKMLKRLSLDISRFYRGKMSLSPQIRKWSKEMFW